MTRLENLADWAEINELMAAWRRRVADDMERAWSPCPPRTEGAKPHCPDCSGIVGETGIV